MFLLTQELWQTSGMGCVAGLTGHYVVILKSSRILAFSRLLLLRFMKTLAVMVAVGAGE